MARKTKITNNWFTSVNSPTYKVTFWLIDQDVWQSPSDLADNSKRTMFLNNGKAVIIAESGVTAQYAIDNIIINSKVNASANSGNTVIGNVTFDLTEPMGFKLVDRIISYSSIQNFDTMQEALYIMQIEFLGTDPDNSYPARYPGIFFLPLKIQDMKATLGPQGSVYNVLAQNMVGTAAIQTKIETDITFTGVYNVRTLLDQVNKKLNETEKKLREKTGGRTMKTWKVVLDKSATIAAEDGVPGFDMGKAQYSGTTDSSPASAGNASKDDKDKRDTTTKSGTNMVSWCMNEITKNVPAWGKYVKKFTDDPKAKKAPILTVTPSVVFKDKIDPETNQREQEVVITIGIKWDYAVPAIDPEKNKQKTSDKAFQISRFKDLPISKIYDYLYTGKNTEIMNFQINFHHLFAVARDPYKGKFYANPSQAATGTHPLYGADIKNPPIPASDKISKTEIQKNSSNFNYLSDTQVDQTLMTAIVKPIYEFTQSSAADQQSNETLGDNIGLDTLAHQQLANRDEDMFRIDLDVIGDPFWMGAPGALSSGNNEDLSKYMAESAMLVVRNYYPDESMLEPENPKKGSMDLLSSGVYTVAAIETKLRRGEFSMTLNCFRDTNTNSLLVREELEKLDWD